MKNWKFDIVNLSLLVIGGLTLLCLCHGEVLWMAAERNLYMQGGQFLNDCLRHAGGLLEYCGRALTCTLHYPWLGGSLLVLLWSVIYLLLRRLCPMAPQWRWLLMVPVAALLISVTDLGYWIYYIKQPGYWFRETLGTLSTVFIAGFSTLLYKNPSVKAPNLFAKILPCLTAICFYPLVGWYAVLALAIIALRNCLDKQWIAMGVALLSGLIAPGLIARLYTTLRAEEAWTAGFPMIESNLNWSWRLTLPFIVVALSLTLLLCLHQHLTKGKNIALAGLPLLIVWVYVADYSDYNYHAEIRNYRNIEEFRFDKVLDNIDQAPVGPTRQMVMQKNLALLYTGHLGDLMFCFLNIGPDPVVVDSLPVHITQIEGPQFYLYHGMANDATHWEIENSVEYGFNICALKHLALAAIVSGESQLAAKYLTMLRLVPFCDDFVKRYYPVAIHPEWIGDYPELELMVELHDDLGEWLDGDQGDCEWRIYRTFSDQLTHASDRAQELALSYSMMRKDYSLFWIHLREYARRHPRQKMPVHYQEAALLGTQLPSQAQSHRREDFRFDDNILMRYQIFCGKQKPAFENSYWWFYHYCTDAKTY